MRLPCNYLVAPCRDRRKYLQGWSITRARSGWGRVSEIRKAKSPDVSIRAFCNVAVREWMIRHCVAHPFGAAVGRSSQQAALLEPGAGSHPPLSASVFAFSGKQKTDPEVGFLNLAVREGFEPSIRCRIHTFQACSFSHSDTSPNFVCGLTCSANTVFAALLRWNGA